MKLKFRLLDKENCSQRKIIPAICPREPESEGEGEGAGVKVPKFRKSTNMFKKTTTKNKSIFFNILPEELAGDVPGHIRNFNKNKIYRPPFFMYN